jgi:hypothetical protein
MSIVNLLSVAAKPALFFALQAPLHEMLSTCLVALFDEMAWHSSDGSASIIRSCPGQTPDGVDVNVRCLDPQPEQLTIEPFDGQHWEDHAATLAHLSVAKN